MRALFFAETPHRLAGSQRSLLAALTRIAAYGIDPLVIFPGRGPVEEAYRASGLPTRIVEAPPALLLFNKKLLSLTRYQGMRVLACEHAPYTARLARTLVEEKCEVVHFNTPRGILIGGLAAKLARRAIVLHLRGVPDGFHRAFWAASQLLADRIVLVARSLEQYVSPVLRQRCTVVYNGVVEQPPRDRLQARQVLATRLGCEGLARSDEVLFVCLSSLTPFKGLHHLLHAAALLRDRGMRARFVCAGGDDDPRYHRFVLEQRAALRLEETVHVLGFVPDPLQLLAAADALVLPSVEREILNIDGDLLEIRGTEGLPRSILEALSLGVPIVASSVEGVTEEVDEGVTGLTTPPSDPVQLACALARVATDTEWRESAGRAGRRVALERFSADSAALGLARVLRAAPKPVRGRSAQLRDRTHRADGLRPD